MSTDHYLSVLAARAWDGTTKPPVLLAPLSGVTDLHLRRIALRLGASAVITEMVAAADYARGDTESRLRAEGDGVVPHIVQLAGCDPSAMAEAARLAAASGADVVDVNMGCPAKTVTGGAAGSALMRDLDHAERILAAVRSAVDVPVTVKMRLGWDDANRNAAILAQRAEALGLNGVTVHGRTRQQFYKGMSDWPAIRAVVEAVRIPVFANGDIGDLAAASACLAASGAAGVMIGRAAIGQPWIVGAIAAALAGGHRPRPSMEERADIAIEHYDGLLGLYGVEMGVRHARKHLAAYLDHAGPGVLSAQDRMRLLTTLEPDLARSLLRQAFAASALAPDSIERAAA